MPASCWRPALPRADATPPLVCGHAGQARISDPRRAAPPGTVTDNENDIENAADDGVNAAADGTDPSIDHLPGRQRSAAIYGTIITAAVLAAGGNALSTVALEATVFVTVVVYWLAEQYAVLLGEHTHSGQLPSKAEILHSMRASFPMVTSSLIPLLVLLVGRLCGLTAFHAAAVAIFVTVAAAHLPRECRRQGGWAHRGEARPGDGDRRPARAHHDCAQDPAPTPTPPVLTPARRAPPPKLRPWG